MIDTVTWQDKVLALILRSNHGTEGVDFITPADSPLQLGVLKHRAGARIRPHVHKDIPRTINRLEEVLHIDQGKVEAEFYGDDGRKVASAALNAGDTILLISGGHGFHILEDSRIIEVKQGPFFGTAEDKVRLAEGGNP
ncbi:MAG: hypothetical protein HY670_09475 [Chloroflexi bacterium]|nr:hypothetical protein [Chloroflexota bacterium]